jgi:hypothetical protein
MEFLASKLIVHFSKKHGDSMHLISPQNNLYCCEEYVYHVYYDHVSVHDLDDEREEESSWEDFETVCNKFDEKEEEEEEDEDD